MNYIPTRSLRIENLPDEITKYHLEKLFPACIQLTVHPWTERRNRHAILTFENVEDAKEAYQRHNGTVLVNTKLDIKYCKPKDKGDDGSYQDGSRSNFNSNYNNHNNYNNYNSNGYYRGNQNNQNYNQNYNKNYNQNYNQNYSQNYNQQYNKSYQAKQNYQQKNNNDGAASSGYEKKYDTPITIGPTKNVPAKWKLIIKNISQVLPDTYWEGLQAPEKNLHVVKIKLWQEKRQANLYFKTQEEAAEAQKAIELPDVEFSLLPTGSESAVYVTKLPYHIIRNDYHLWKLFNDKGCEGIVNASLQKYQGKSRGYGFVNFKSKADGEAAVAKMQGMELGGVIIEVRLKTDRPPSPTHEDHHEEGSSASSEPSSSSSAPHSPPPAPVPPPVDDANFPVLSSSSPSPLPASSPSPSPPSAAVSPRSSSSAASSYASVVAPPAPPATPSPSAPAAAPSSPTPSSPPSPSSASSSSPSSSSTPPSSASSAPSSSAPPSYAAAAAVAPPAPAPSSASSSPSTAAPSTPPPPRILPGNKGQFTLVVFRLPHDWTGKTLERLYGSSPGFDSAKVVFDKDRNPLGYGYLNFRTQETAEQALMKLKFSGIGVTWDDKTSKKLDNMVRITGVDPTLSDKDFEEFCDGIPCASCTIIYKKDGRSYEEAIITFATPEQAIEYFEKNKTGITLQRRLMGVYLENTVAAPPVERAPQAVPIPTPVPTPTPVPAPISVPAPAPVPAGTAPGSAPGTAPSSAPVSPTAVAVPINPVPHAALGYDPNLVSVIPNLDPAVLYALGHNTLFAADPMHNHITPNQIAPNPNPMPNPMPTPNANPMPNQMPNQNQMPPSPMQHQMPNPLPSMEQMLLQLQGMVMSNMHQLDLTAALLPNAQQLSSLLNANMLNLSTENVQRWNCDEVGSWLQSVNLGKHVKKFAEEGVDGHTLLIIQKISLIEDLKITPTAEVIKIWHAIENLRRKCGYIH